MYLDEKDVAYAIYTLAEDAFPQQEYGEPMPRFQLRGADGLALFEAAINAPRQRFPRTKHEKAAVLFRSLIKNHPLVDGNKRMAVIALSSFLLANRVDFKVSKVKIVEAALAVASYPGNFPLETLTKWIRAGCTGRPKSIVSQLADDWPAVRTLLQAVARTTDRREGIGPRVPGRRVCVPRDFWEEARRIVEGQPTVPVQGRLFDN